MSTPDNTGEQTSGSHLSSWFKDESNLETLPLGEDLTTETVIIGGGISGLLTAYELARSGKSVVVIEDGHCGSGETGRTTAHLTCLLDNNFSEYIDDLGEENARLLISAHMHAIDYIESVVDLESIGCDFRRLPSYLFPHPSAEADFIDKELHAARLCGLDAVKTDKVPGMKNPVPGIRIDNQGQFHPLKFLSGLMTCIRRHGGKIYTNTHASEISHDFIETSEGFTVRANHVVVATNSTVNNKIQFSFKQAPFRTFVVAGKIPKNALPIAMWMDSGDKDRDPENAPYHYIRTQPFDDTHDLLICGGEDHPTGVPGITHPPMTDQQRYGKLAEYAKEHFGLEEVQYNWSGQVLESIDGVQYIGRNPFDDSHVYVVTGDCGDGITAAGIAAQLITDLIWSRESIYEDLFRPSRHRIKEGMDFVKTTVKSLVELFKHHHPEAKEPEAGEGAIIEIDKKPCAVYKDESGELTVLSATCPHAGCTVGWNSDEKTWDCPCHGSRFTARGTVINGPANKNLPPHTQD